MIKRILFTFLGTGLLLTSVFAQEASSKVALGEYKYTMKMSGGAQEMEFDINRTVKEEDGNIVINDNISTPFGSSESIFTVDSENFETISLFSTGFAASDIKFEEGKITGETSDFRGNKTPVDIETEGVVYCGGSAVEPLLTNLPLEIGYKNSMKVFIPNQTIVANVDMEVTAKEMIEVPGGSFETYRLELSNPDFADFKQSTWITIEAPRMIIKEVIASPQGKIEKVYAGKKGEKKKKKKKKKE